MNERRPSYFDSGSQGRLSIRSSYSIDFQSINSFLQLAKRLMNRLGENFHGRKFIGTKFIVAKIIHERFSVEKKKLLPLSFQGEEERRLNFIQPSSTTRVHREATQISFENRAACELARFGERETTKARTIINASNQAGVGGGEAGTQAFSSSGSRKGHHVSTLPLSPFYFRRRGLQANGPALSGNP